MKKRLNAVRLDMLGSAHVFVVVLAVTLFSLVGSYMLVKGHAQLTPIGGGGKVSISSRVYSMAHTRAGYARYVFDTPCPNDAYLTCVKGVAAPSTFDCSGLVAWAIIRVTNGGINLPHNAAEIWQHRSTYASKGIAVTVAQSSLQVGDIVFFVGAEAGASTSAPGHIGIYAGKDSSGNRLLLDAYSSHVASNLQVNVRPFYRETGGYVGALRFFH